MVRLRLPLTLAIGFLLLSALGCGPTHLKPKGKLTKGGEPLKLSDKGVIQIALYAISDNAFAAPQAVNWKTDGTFEVVGRQGNGVVAGKYRVSIEIFDPYTSDGKAKDLLEGKMAKGNSAIIEVKDASEIVIDVAKK
jgi:hypothetical protein